MEHLLQDPTVWVGIGFFIFVALFVWKAFPLLGKGLDDYGNKIATEIATAQALRKEAQELLDAAEKKSAAAERNASEIIERAKFEAKLIADEAEKDIEREIERKMKIAEEKIQRAEVAAVENVRKKAVEKAIEAASEAIRKELTGAKSEQLVEKSLRLISNKL